MRRRHHRAGTFHVPDTVRFPVADTGGPDHEDLSGDPVADQVAILVAPVTAQLADVAAPAGTLSEILPLAEDRGRCLGTGLGQKERENLLVELVHGQHACRRF